MFKSFHVRIAASLAVVSTTGLAQSSIAKAGLLPSISHSRVAVMQEAAPPEHTNRLINETSPYLLQHAHNPVDWYPWGEEAFAKARAENKLIFLSVGYSTCYWCHVMERESFENEDIARIMNESFVCIKVDREERPDVAAIYMSATQLITGSGGWPMSVWLVPDTLKPVHAGTYFPAEPRGGMMSFPDLCKRIVEVWQTREPELRELSERVGEAVQQNLESSQTVFPLSRDQVNMAFLRLMESYDEEHGGFGGAPKFPQPVFIDLLLTVRDRLSDDSRSRVDAAIRNTLDRMATGGMYDQVGGGFHRYSTDEEWLVPHFEKMLYDNAQLIGIYARAGIIYEDWYYAEIADEIYKYTMREMTDPRGGLYSAQDAEVDAREGLNYLWTDAEVRNALADAGREDLIEFARKAYGIDRGTNFRDPHHPEDKPKNVLFLIDRPDVVAKDFGLPLEEVKQNLRAVNAALLNARQTRQQPRLDDKILTEWNGLMIAGLAEAGHALGHREYIQAAARAAKFLLANLRTEDGGLLRSYRGEQSNVPAFLEDYAAFSRGLIALHVATSEQVWLDIAIELTDRARDLFFDEVHGGYFDTLPDQSDLFVRTRTTYDGAVPCGNSMMLANLLALHDLTGKERFLDDAASTLQALSGAIARNPLATALSTIALESFATRFSDRLPRGKAVANDDRGAVKVSADRESVHVSGDGPGRLLLTLDIADGFHINAHEPGDETLTGLLIELVDGEGLVVNAGYPDGQPYQESVRIYRGTVVIPVEIQRVGDIPGTPKLVVRWQTCTDTECLEPESHVLNISIVDGQSN